MDINEEIVRSWLELQGFLVKSRFRYQVTRGATGKNKAWSDIDLIAYRLHDGKRVAVDISAWMRESVTLGYITDEKTHYRLFKATFPEARSALCQEFGVHNDDQYEIWLVVSFLGDRQREEVEAECLKYVNRVITFPEIMNDLIAEIKQHPGPARESEALQTIRALELCGLLPDKEISSDSS